LIRLVVSSSIAHGMGWQVLASAQEAAAPAASEQQPQPPALPVCVIDLRLPGVMSDVLSNVLIRGEQRPESEVNAFLEEAKLSHPRGEDLRKATADHFKIDQKRLEELVEFWRHVNCKHAAIPGYASTSRRELGAASRRALSTGRVRIKSPRAPPRMTSARWNGAKTTG
jgi:hypothetical protein